MQTALIALLAYCLGSVSFAVLVSRAMRLPDPRSYGSKNPGATNVLRSGSKLAAALTLIGDAGKGALAVWLAVLYTGESPVTGFDAALAGVMAHLGHVFPVFLRFKGGKGVATACGALVALEPVVFLWGGAAWIATVALTRYVGLASVVMLAACAAAAWFLRGGERPELALGAALLFALILVRHRSNISRMLAGTEPRLFGPKRKGPGGPP
jgi:glycerol-3-phosphate acyltransferase PlsY